MYIPYRKAYISGMNPLSFVTVFTIGELGTCSRSCSRLMAEPRPRSSTPPRRGTMLFWLFLGGFVWVIGDLFQQFATKYLGIGRGIPLSNTNQMWGLAWGALVFGELAHADAAHRLLVVVGSLVMICGALAVTTAVATEKERASTREAVVRECARYDLDYDRVVQAYQPAHVSGCQFRAPRMVGLRHSRRCGIGVFIWLGINARVPQLAMNLVWIGRACSAFWCRAPLQLRSLLWKSTRFS